MSHAMRFALGVRDDGPSDLGLVAHLCGFPHSERQQLCGFSRTA